jgi:hypothetical protein
MKLDNAVFWPYRYILSLHNIILFLFTNRKVVLYNLNRLQKKNDSKHSLEGICHEIERL